MQLQTPITKTSWLRASRRNPNQFLKTIRAWLRFFNDWSIQRGDFASHTINSHEVPRSIPYPVASILFRAIGHAPDRICNAKPQFLSPCRPPSNHKELRHRKTEMSTSMERDFASWRAGRNLLTVLTGPQPKSQESEVAQRGLQSKEEHAYRRKTTKRGPTNNSLHVGLIDLEGKNKRKRANLLKR